MGEKPPGRDGIRHGFVLMVEVTRLFPDVVQPKGDASALRLAETVRIAEALLFASAVPLPEADIAARLPVGTDVAAVLGRLKSDYTNRGVQLVRVGAKWLFRTADDLGWLLSASGREQRKLSRAAMETLAIIAYHQPATRAEIEDIRGVAISKGTLDVLMETGWVKLRGRRRAPGRPVTYGTTEGFLVHFGLETIGDLPGLDELRGAGLFDGRLPPSFAMPLPTDGDLRDDEEPLESDAEHGEEDLDDEVGPLEAEDYPQIDSIDRDPFG